MMSLREIVALYRARSRVRSVLAAEALAVLGIAIGTALLFASQVASTSLDSSVRALGRSIAGAAQFQLDARGPAGGAERLVGEAERLPDVQAAVPLLEQPATLRGPSGSAEIELIGLAPSFALRERLRRAGVEPIEALRSLALSPSVASSIGAETHRAISVQTGIVQSSAVYGGALSQSVTGSLLDSQIAFGSLAYVQRLTEKRARLTRIFIRVRPGTERRAQATLAAFAERHALNLGPADFEVAMFAVASAPTEKGEQLFSAISAIVGFLFALNAILLLVPERRRLVAAMRRRGTTRAMVLQALAFDGLVLGLLAACLGLLLGELASALLFHVQPGYLAFAFPVGSARVVTWQTIALAVGAGLLAAFAGVLVPLRATIARPLRAALFVEARGPRVATVQVAGGLLSLALTTLILLRVPQDAVPGSLLLLIALLCLLPLCFRLVLAGAARAARVLRLPAVRVAVVEIEDPLSRVHLLAVAATGAVAVFGGVAIQGAQQNLQSGLDRTSSEWSGITSLWVSVSGVNNTLATTPFDTNVRSALERVAGIESVAVYRGSFLDVGSRRLWVIAPPDSAHMIASGQLVRGVPRVVEARLREGGWVVISEAMARELRLGIGDELSLPTPVPGRVRIAGLSTNNGWAPGVAMLSAQTYSRMWATTEASALNIGLRANASPSRVRGEVERVLGPRSGLTVQTDRERQRAGEATSRQGLSRLSQIGVLMSIAATAAVSGVMSSTIRQRRPRIRALKRQGFARGFLWRVLLCESAVVIAAGCLIGGAFGLYGQLLISRALARVTGFPMAGGIATSAALWSAAAVCSAALAIVSVSSLLVVRERASDLR